MTRLTPSFDSEYRDQRLRLSGRYTFDAERYDAHESLSTVDARQQGAVDLRYSLTSRVVWSAGGEIARTRMPSELFAETGLLLPRARASRVTGRSTLTRELGPRTEGVAGYVFSEDRIQGGITLRTHTATFGVDRRLSSRTSSRIEYRGTLDSFDSSSRGFRLQAEPDADAASQLPAEGESHESGLKPLSVSSHAITAGWTRQLTSRLSMSVIAGPRLTGGRFVPELFMSLRSRWNRGDVSMSYQRTQTTVIGVARPVDIETVTSRVVWGAARGPSLNVTPAFYRSRAQGRRTDVYRVALGFDYPIGDKLSLDMSVDTSVQSGRLQPFLPEGTIDRHTASIRLVTAPFAKRAR